YTRVGLPVESGKSEMITHEVLGGYYIHDTVSRIELHNHVAGYVKISIAASHIQLVVYNPVGRTAEDSRVDVRAKSLLINDRWVGVVFCNHRRIDGEIMSGANNAPRTDIGVVIVGCPSEDIVAVSSFKIEIEGPHRDRLRFEPEDERVGVVIE